MQLREAKSPGVREIGVPLAAATCALLGHAVPAEVEAQELMPWEFDASVLLYAESDGRVQDASIDAIARKELREEGFLTITAANDSLTGASPSGAVPANVAQTFTSPSGNSQYHVGVGEQVLDSSFHDTRTALSANYEWPVTRLSLFSIGASFSSEFDYEHFGLDAHIARDFNNRNTTLSFGAALANDSVNPVGGAPIELSPMLGEENHANKRGNESKDVVDLLVGVTQVLSRKTLLQVNYSQTKSDGYLTDPYKLLSVVDPTTGDPVAGPAGSGLYRYLYESRPSTRDKQSLFGLLKHDFDGDVLEASYRYMTDDWGVDSHTLDLRYRLNFGSGKYLQPHLRFYNQTAADFYHTVLLDGAPVPEFATADYRLGKFDGVTVGIKYGQETRSGEWSARLEWYQQTGTPDATAAVGSLTAFDLYPDLNALIAQFSYKFRSW